MSSEFVDDLGDGFPVGTRREMAMRVVERNRFNSGAVLDVLGQMAWPEEDIEALAVRVRSLASRYVPDER